MRKFDCAHELKVRDRLFNGTMHVRSAAASDEEARICNHVMVKVTRYVACGDLKAGCG